MSVWEMCETIPTSILSLSMLAGHFQLLNSLLFCNWKEMIFKKSQKIYLTLNFFILKKEL